MPFSTYVMELKRIVLLSLVTTNLIVIAAYYNLMGSWINGSRFNYQLVKVSTRKKILLWNSPNRIEASAFGTGHQAFLDAKCLVYDCEIVANSSEFWSLAELDDFKLLAEFDAILINVHELWLSSLLPHNYSRPKKQRLVFFTQESPLTMSVMGLDVEKLDGVFNWTMTYRMDSDIRFLYGRVHDRTSL